MLNDFSLRYIVVFQLCIDKIIDNYHIVPDNVFVAYHLL